MQPVTGLNTENEINAPPFFCYTVSMDIISWNVNGIRAIEKKGFSKWLEKESPEIMCLQETKAHPGQLDEKLRSPDGYHSFFSSAEKKGYSGTAVFSKTLPEKIEHGIGIPEMDNEGRILILHYTDFSLFNCYFPNGKSSEERLDYKMRFYNAVYDHICSSDRLFIVCGDVNTAHKEIDLARPGPNSDRSGFLPIERAWIDKFTSSDYVDVFRYFHKDPEKYTWWDYKTRARERNTGWRIDYFFAHNKLMDRIKDCIHMDSVTGSDHCPVKLIMS